MLLVLMGVGLVWHSLRGDHEVDESLQLGRAGEWVHDFGVIDVSLVGPSLLVGGSDQHKHRLPSEASLLYSP